jgi:DivIVA domain-containing protein
MRRKKADGQGASTEAEGRLSPADVQQVEFRLAFRGYNERDVDGFLDRVTEELSSYIEENRRLREGAGPAEGVGGRGSEADEMLARAREEAGAIVRRAEEQAAEMVAGAGGGGAARAALAPFLNAEREFLQSLGSLVQTHAEEVRRMVLALRARAEGAPATEGTTSEAVAPATAPAAADPSAAGSAPEDLVIVDRSPQAQESSPPLEPATAAEIGDRLAASEESSGPTPTTTEAGSEAGVEPAPADAPIVVEPATEPALSSEGASTPERRERSLRELFWGED